MRLNGKERELLMAWTLAPSTLGWAVEEEVPGPYAAWTKESSETGWDQLEERAPPQAESAEAFWLRLCVV